MGTIVAVGADRFVILLPPSSHLRSLTAARIKSPLRRTKLVEKHAPAARVQRFCWAAFRTRQRILLRRDFKIKKAVNRTTSYALASTSRTTTISRTCPGCRSSTTTYPSRDRRRRWYECRFPPHP